MENKSNKEMVDCAEHRIVRHSSFFSDEEYEEIIKILQDTPFHSYDKDKLPFQGIQLYSHDEYVVNSYKDKGKDIFYIKDKKLFSQSTLAYGYYDTKKDVFYLLKNSKINESLFTKVLLKHGSILNPEDFEVYHGILLHDIICSTPSIAASLVRGEKTYSQEWVNSEGNELEDFYDEFKAKSYIGKNNYADASAELSEKYNLSNIISGLLQKGQSTQQPHLKTVSHYNVIQSEKEWETENKSENHCVLPKIKLFYLKRDNGDRSCNATGYYDKITGSFIVMKDSMISLGVSDGYSVQEAGKIRMKIIKKYCSKFSSSVFLKKDYMFRSPNDAAGFVLGRVANGMQEWKNADGIPLAHFY